MVEKAKSPFEGSLNIDWIVGQVQEKRRQQQEQQTKQKDEQTMADHDEIFKDKVYMKRLFETLVEKHGYDSDNLTSEQAQEIADDLYHTVFMPGGSSESFGGKAVVEKVIKGVQNIRDKE